MILPSHSQAHCPDWYPSLRAAKFAGVPWTETLGVPWSPFMEQWALIAEAAESEAEAYLVKQAQKKAGH